MGKHSSSKKEYPMLNDALNGKILNINLSSGAIEPEEIPEETYRAYLGGYGLGARLLFDRIPQGADPLGPENILGFFPGLLTGTPLFGIRYQAVAKSSPGTAKSPRRSAPWNGVAFSMVN